MVRACSSRVLFFWLVVSALTVTIVLVSSLLSSIAYSSDIDCGVSFSLYVRTVENDSSPHQKRKSLTSDNSSITDAATELPAATYALPRPPVTQQENSTGRSTRHVANSSDEVIGYKRLGHWSANTVTPTTAPTPNPRLNFATRERGYILSLDITQQIFGALHGYTDLATLGALLGLSSVEPYIYGSSLVGVPILSQAPRALKLSTLYDSDNLQSVLKTCSANNDHEMSTFETFLERASGKVIFVYLLTSVNHKKFSFTGNRSIIQLGNNSNTARKAVSRLNEWAAYVSYSRNLQSSILFALSNVFVIDVQPKQPLHLSHVLDVLGSAIHEKTSEGPVTLLFNNWEGIHNKPDSPTFYYIPEYVHRPCHPNIYKASHSRRVIDAAYTFGRSMGDNKTMTRIGIHIRAERVLNLHREGFVVCLDKLKELMNRITNDSLTSAQVRLIHDLGKYGTRSCYGHCEFFKKDFMYKINELRLPSVHFYPEAYGNLPKNPAFVSAVEQEYLSRMDVLVTVGSGGFQSSTVAKFMQHAEIGKNHLYRICSRRFTRYKDLVSVF